MKQPFSSRIACALIAVCAGCHPKPAEPASQSELDIAAVHSISDTGVTAAILAQHTLFPYHFVTGSDQLNDLGRRELAVLAAHYRQVGGDLGVRRGDEPPALYDDRVKQVRESLLLAGVPAERVAISDGPPGGPGISSDRVVSILALESKEGGQAGSAGGAAGMSKTGTVGAQK